MKWFEEWKEKRERVKEDKARSSDRDYPFCKDCKYIANSTAFYVKCSHTLIVPTWHIDPVNGASYTKNVYCDEAREIGAKCGLAGRLWEAKE